MGARSASESAHKAATATNNRIENHLQAIDLERARWLLQRVKLLHDTGRWEAALEQYESLRMILSDVLAHSREDQTELREKLSTARAIVTTMEQSVRGTLRDVEEDPDWPLLDESLDGIQSTLEELASTLRFATLPEEAT